MDVSIRFRQAATGTVWQVLACLLLALVMVAPVHAKARPLRDLAHFAGVRDNVLVGYGLVVGLDGTGDQTMQTPFTVQGLKNMFSRLGITIPDGSNMQLRNVAAVMVTAKLPPFAASGQHIDVVVSSVGNAKSLRGGTLLMTPLKGINGKTYAIAQGHLLVGGAGASANGSSVQVNQTAGGSISGGAIVERSVPVNLGRDHGMLKLQLERASFGTAERVVQTINKAFGRPVAAATNARTIHIQGPKKSNRRVTFMARVLGLKVTPAAASAKVVINARTGTVVLNQHVSLKPAAVAYGGLSVVINTQNRISQPAPFGSGRTARVSNSRIAIREQEGSLHVVKGADLMQVVHALNALGATPQDLMSILEALKASGSLNADLVVM